MKNFNDIGRCAASCRMSYEKSPSESEQRLAAFAGVLEQQLGITKDDAAVYASIVLKRNGEASAVQRSDEQM